MYLEIKPFKIRNLKEEEKLHANLGFQQVHISDQSVGRLPFSTIYGGRSGKQGPTPLPSSLSVTESHQQVPESSLPEQKQQNSVWS